MWNHRRQTWIAVPLCFVLIQTAITTPIYVPQFLPSGTGRNIRHLPCVSRRTGETGICMFAFTCAKANGTHLGTCIDRFYFGSCCKIDEEPDVGPQDNSIDDGPPAASRPFVTTHGPIESNDIPPYFPRPKPFQDQSTKSPGTSYTSTVSAITQATQSTPSTTGIYGESTKTATKIVPKRPTTTEAIETTTQSIRLSTFQTVQNASNEKLSTSALVRNTTKTSTETTQSISSSSSTLTTSKLSVQTTQKPTTPSKPSTLSLTVRPTVGTSKPITKRPIEATVLHATTQTSVQRPVQTTTTRTIVTTTQKTQPPTRFPPRNTTSVKPVTQQSTKRPPTSGSTKRPLVTSTKRPTLSTKKPSLPTKKPSTSGTLSSGSSHGTKPIIGTTATTVAPIKFKPTTSKLKPTLTTTERNVVSTTEGTVATSVTQTSFVTRKPVATTTERPIQHKTTTRPKTTTSKTTTFRTTTSKPIVTIATSTKPTKIGTTGQVATTRPQSSITTEKITVQASTTSGSTLGITKPRPTETPIRTTVKPVRITTPTTVSSTTTSFVTSSSSTVSTLSTATPKVPSINQTLEEVPQTTTLPGFVTWSSHSNETPTKAPEVSSTTKVHEEITESEWTPITTPDGWVMIQSPTTGETFSTSQESSTSKLESVTVASSTVPVKSTTESTTSTTTATTERVTETPAILTTLSSIATIAVNTETPIPIESLNMSDYKQVCGRRLFPQSRIVGGSQSTFGKWPWQISLRQWKTSTYLHKCGAALLNENWAITAAHCVENVSPADLLLRIGEHDLANEEEPYGFQERRVQIIASHPQFDPRTFEYDLALLRFYEPLPTFQPNVLPICLPDDDESYVGRTAYVTGWGRLFDEGPLPSILQEVAVPVINNTVCEAMYRNAGYIEHIPHIFICAGWRNGGFDSCEGDSGGPMVIQRARDKRWVLAGVISWGIGCAVPNQPGVYTRISEFREWINQILQF